MSVTQRMRAISPSIASEVEFVELPREVRGFAMLLHFWADDHGRASASPAMIRGGLYPCDDDLPLDEIQLWLMHLEDVGFLTLYEDHGRAYLQILEWATPPDAQPSRYPAPEATVTAPVAAQPPASATTVHPDAPNASQSHLDAPTGSVPQPRSPEAADPAQTTPDTPIAETHDTPCEMCKFSPRGRGGEREPVLIREREREREGERVPTGVPEGQPSEGQPEPRGGPGERRGESPPTTAPQGLPPAAGTRSRAPTARPGRGRAATREETDAALLALDVEPSTFCSRHPAGTEDPCGPCGVARRRHDRWWELQNSLYDQMDAA